MWRRCLQNDLLNDRRDSKKRGEHTQTFYVYLGFYMQKDGRRAAEIAGQQRWLVERGQTTNKTGFDLRLQCTNLHDFNTRRWPRPLGTYAHGMCVGIGCRYRTARLRNRAQSKCKIRTLRGYLSDEEVHDVFHMMLIVWGGPGGSREWGRGHRQGLA